MRVPTTTSHNVEGPVGLEESWDKGIWDILGSWDLDGFWDWIWEFVDLDEFWDTLGIDFDWVLGLCWSICIQDE